MQAEINAVWIGDRMGPVHAACLRSFLDHGHEVRLHAFAPVSDAPEGVEHFDAERLMRRDEVFAYRDRGSFALAADIYRYRILKAGLGIYVDCDVFCLKPWPAADFLFGQECGELVNNAVLAMPKDSALLNDLVAATSNPYFVPPWISPLKRLKHRWRIAVGRPIHVADMPWGTFGPWLLTDVLARHKLLHLAQPPDVFYPVHHVDAGRLNDPNVTLADLVTERTLGLHLWNSGISTTSLLPGSVVGRIAGIGPERETSPRA